MDADKVKDMLSDRDIYDLLQSLDGEPKSKGNVLMAKTICHCGDSHKLTYYRDTKTFFCYTNCGYMSVFDLVANALDISFKESLKYIMKKYNISDDNHFEDGFAFDKIENPGRLLDKKLKKVDFPVFNILDDKIMDDFYNFYHKTWIDDGISVNSMKKYGIRYSILENQIIIPHRDENGKLIGVRARNLNKDLVDEGKKYIPIYHEGKVLKHLTGANLYGLDINKEAINRIGVCILFESEKSVQQLDTMYPDASIGLCVSGSSLTVYQLEILKNLNIEEVIIGVDKEFDEIGTEEELFYADRVKSIFKKKLSPFFKVSVLWDKDNMLNKKDSPVDKGKEVFSHMLKNRIFI